MAEGKQFDIAVVITAGTGRYVCGEVGRIYEIYNFMTNDDLFTHQLPRAGRVCAPYLVEQYPWLAEMDKDLLDLMIEGKEGAGLTAACEQWVAPLREKYGDELLVYPVAIEDWERIHPIEEADHMLRPDQEVIVIHVDEKNELEEGND